jgi:hypothetical protein
MGQVFGIVYGEGTERLLRHARRLALPEELSIRRSSEIPVELGAKARGARGVYVHEHRTVFLNPERPDTDEHTLAHELGHCIVWARGWPEVRPDPDLDPEIAASFYELLVNRLQHITMEPDLLHFGLDTGPGHSVRVERDIAGLCKKLEAASPDDPGVFVSWGVKYAEAAHCASARDVHRLREALVARCPRAFDLGRSLAAAVAPKKLRTLAGAREGTVAWMNLLDAAIARTAIPDAVKSLTAFAVSPVMVPRSSLKSAAREFVSVEIATVDRRSLDATIRWRDGSVWGFRQLTSSCQLEEEQIQRERERLVSLSLAEFAQHFSLAVIT